MLASFAGRAESHAFGGRYDLPLPLELYLIGAASAVVASFLVMALAFNAPKSRENAWRVAFGSTALGKLIQHRWTAAVAGAVSLFLFVLVLASGYFGRQDVLANFAPSFVWVIWWVGLVYVVALVGNIWPAFNPWSASFTLAERAYPRLQDGFRAYPGWLGKWPAVFLFGMFAWLELVHEGAANPRTLANFVLAYSVVTWMGMAVFGRRAWLADGEAFTSAFGISGALCPDRPTAPGR